MFRRFWIRLSVMVDYIAGKESRLKGNHFERVVVFQKPYLYSRIHPSYLLTMLKTWIYPFTLSVPIIFLFV